MGRKGVHDPDEVSQEQSNQECADMLRSRQNRLKKTYASRKPIDD
jgi:hypothetical protein